MSDGPRPPAAPAPPPRGHGISGSLGSHGAAPRPPPAPRPPAAPAPRPPAAPPPTPAPDAAAAAPPAPPDGSTGGALPVAAVIARSRATRSAESAADRAG